ncbi:MAG: hypothetical protein J7621_30405 [Niastella sp.]|nr:hypothetical protein [Niastella sp.]
MRHLFFLSIALVSLTNVIAQKATVTSELLTDKQVAALLPDTLRKVLHINFPIFRTYRYTDKEGVHYCILTESREKITTDGDTINLKIKAINVKVVNGTLVKVWEINDNIIKDERNESSIWFWTKYADFKDYDGDGLAEPVITYGTAGMNGYGDGRIKFIIYYKGQKTAIRHQNGVLDYERETQVDKSFYVLPQALQAGVKQKMELMVANERAIFPAGWQKDMKNKETQIDERQ